MAWKGANVVSLAPTHCESPSQLSSDWDSFLPGGRIMFRKELSVLEKNRCRCCDQGQYYKILH